MPDRDTSNTPDVEPAPAQSTPQPAANNTPVVTGESVAAAKGPSAAADSRAATDGVPVVNPQPATKQAKDGAAQQAPGQTPGQTPAVKPQPSSSQNSVGKISQEPGSPTKPSPSTRPSASRTSVRQPTKRKKERKWPRIFALVVLIAVVSIVSLSAWQYWLRFDDAADIQGTWVMQGSTEKITITENDIVLSADVSYGYSMDSGAKRITYTFGSLSGSGSYHFTNDRNTVIIRERDTVDVGVALGLSDDPALLATDNLENGIIVLRRVS